ncbi:MAG: hypothetical protein AB4426_35635 [Xenococcaceae cyanobacterium]
MNPPVNRSSESPHPSGNQPLESSNLSTKPEIAETDRAEIHPPSTPVDSTEANPSSQRQQPIPPPSNPKQYRAIGLIQGKYQLSEEELTRGSLLMSDGTAIDAVLLGRVISLVKNHLDLEQPHLWVVYPRTRQQDDQLHVQIVGVWEPETLSQAQPPSAEEKLSSSASVTPSPDSIPQPTAKTQDGYFSVRGEVVYYSQEKETVIVKIKQSPRRESEKPKFFKLKLKGTLPDKPVRHFWDLEVQLQANNLVIQEATDIGLLPGKTKPQLKKGGKKYPSKRSGRRYPSDSRPIPKGKKAAGVKPSQNRRPVPKPTKKND